MVGQQPLKLFTPGSNPGSAADNNYCSIMM